jgi:hypothetical protein
MLGTSCDTNGANTIAAMKPSTTLGRLAMTSITGLMRARVRRCMNSLVYTAANSASGAPNNIE